MRKNILSGVCVVVLVFSATSVPAESESLHTENESLRVASVVPLNEQPQQTDAATIWYDDFDGPTAVYGEAAGPLCGTEHFGDQGQSLLQHYGKGKQGEGNRKVFFGDNPMRNSVRRGEKFDDIYWRIYVKHQPGWTGGGPDKLSRATTLVSPKWNQGIIAHVWSTGETLTLDPATGIKNNEVQTTRYNDFANLHWLGNKPNAKTNLFSQEESGWWVCVEAHAKLNTPGEKDGVFQLWIDGQLESERTQLDWRGTWDEKGINAVFLESYWNKGSPVDQSRWVDLFVISSKPIGPVVVPCNPVLIRSRFTAKDTNGWRAELADEKHETVWMSNLLAKDQDRVAVDTKSGTFLGSLQGKTRLDSDQLYSFRLRRENESRWTRYHQQVKTGKP